MSFSYVKAPLLLPKLIRCLEHLRDNQTPFGCISGFDFEGDSYCPRCEFFDVINIDDDHIPRILESFYMSEELVSEDVINLLKSLLDMQTPVGPSIELEIT